MPYYTLHVVSEDSSLQEDISPTSPQHMYSSSVPVTVPTWSRRLSIKDDDEERVRVTLS